MPRSSRAGRYVQQQGGGELFSAFIPAPLPPHPPVELGPELQRLLERASQALGRLDGSTVFLPDPGLFLYMYVRKEAVLSSQIEGTQSSLSDLLLFESSVEPTTSVDDVSEVANYVAAMNHGLRRIRDEGFPVSLRLIREIHGILMKDARGGTKAPGEFRRSQNWIGGTRPGNARFVPPPPHEIMPALGNLESFIHDSTHPMPLLVKAGIAHAQFETIHPFLDGNGRLGRLLITFSLCADGALKQPLLYLSLFFKQHRDAYYEALQRVRTAGDWEGWLRFYLEGVAETAEQATETSRRIVQLFEEDKARILMLGRSGHQALRAHEELKRRAYTTINAVAERLDVTYPTASKAIEQLEALDIVEEVTGRLRDKVYRYREYVELLAADTREPDDG